MAGSTELAKLKAQAEGSVVLSLQGSLITGSTYNGISITLGLLIGRADKCEFKKMHAPAKKNKTGSGARIAAEAIEVSQPAVFH